MSNYIGDFEVDGAQVIDRFETFLLTGALTATSQFRNAAHTGPPEFWVRDIVSGALMVSPGLTVDLDSPIQGQHRMIVDFTSTNSYLPNRSYELICTDGEIDADGQGGWVSVTGQSLRRWSGAYRSEGQLLNRIVKLAGFTVESSPAPTTTEFAVSFPNISSPPPGYFANQNIVWEPGTQNFGIGRAIRTSTDAGGGNVLLQLMEALPVVPSQGDSGTVLPEERPKEQYWCNIKAEYGGPDTYTGEWFRGTSSVLPSQVSGNCTITVTRGSTDVIIINGATMTQSVSTPGWYRYVEGSQLIAPNDIARIEMSLNIDGALRTWSRSLAYQV